MQSIADLTSIETLMEALRQRGILPSVKGHALGNIPVLNGQDIFSHLINQASPELGMVNNLAKSATMGMMGGGMGPGPMAAMSNLAGAGGAAGGAAAAGLGGLGIAMPIIGAAGGLLSGLGSAIDSSKQRKEQAKSRRLNEFAVGSNASQGNQQMLMALMALLGRGGLTGR